PKTWHGPLAVRPEAARTSERSAVLWSQEPQRMEADTWATCTARLEAGELGDWTDPRTNTPWRPPLARGSRVRRQAASGHQRSVRHTKRRPGATERTLVSSRVLPPRSLDPTHDRSMKASAPRPEKELRSPGDKFALDVGPSTIDGH